MAKSVNKLGALQQGMLVAGLIVACFAISSVMPEESSATAPESVFTLPTVALARTAPETKVIAALNAGRTDDARRIVLAEIGKAKEPSLGRLRWLLAKASPDIADARAPLEALAKSDHLLARWARLRLTERLRDRDPHAAVESAELLMLEQGFRARAEPLLALSLFAEGRYVEAEPLLCGLVAEAPERAGAIQYGVPLATILADKPDLDSKKQALALYRQVLTRAPTSNQADTARNAAQALLATMPPAQRIALANFTADEAFAEAEAWAKAREYKVAADRFAGIAQRFKGDAKIVCDAKLGQAKAYYSGSRKAEGLTLFQDVARACPSAEHRAEASFNAGRGLLRRGDPRGAVAHYDQVANAFPNHKLADDSLLAAASAFEDLNDTASARNRLKKLLELPAGDMRADGRFMLAWLERHDKRYEAALEQLTRLVEEGAGESSEDIMGRAAYWRGRTLMDMKKRDEAEDALRALVKARPFSYYAQQAMARLDELDPAQSKALIAELREDPQAEASRLRLADRPELQREEFRRAIELLRVSEVPYAIDELDGLGCFKPNAQDELYMLGASLLQEFGADAQGTSLARRRVRAIMSQPPRGQNLAFWRVVFPRAYRPLVEDAARKVDLPASFVRAIAREESSFDPNAVSPANAYGLIQLIRPTARTYAGPLKLPSDPDSLKNPEINLRIGTSFMRSLFDRYQQNAAIVPAAYNAGPGAADRWLRERGHLNLDEWVETIPYMETRKYTRRVLQSYGVYAWLDEGRVPPLSKTLPRSGSAERVAEREEPTPERTTTSPERTTTDPERAATSRQITKARD